MMHSNSRAALIALVMASATPALAGAIQPGLWQTTVHMQMAPMPNIPPAVAAQMAQGGTWGGHWSAPKTGAVGYGSRLLSNAACLVNTNPGYNGSSTGFYAGGSCGAQTRAVQQGTGGYWYDIYKGTSKNLLQ